MFDFGFAEMLVIGIVALLVIGPERLPSVARKAGTYFARIRRFVTNVRADVEREFRTDELQKMLEQQKDELQSLRNVVNETRKDIDLESIEKTIRDTGEEVMSDESHAQSDKDKEDGAEKDKPNVNEYLP
ncbi:MAG: Sec-independent protein translocase protein TatB [Gammaproteobacteria bacterium]|nr:Sec-independent protein translocase protein TatB [Gammaproteobacteria bacterium]